MSVGTKTTTKGFKMKLSLAIVEKKRACSEGKEWYIRNPCKTVQECIEKLLVDSNSNALSWANCLLNKMYTKKQNVQYAIFAAEQVIDIYEKQWPDDKRPRNAIDAAKTYLKNSSVKNKNAAGAAWAARDAWDAARKEMQIRIIKFGVTLLK